MAMDKDDAIDMIIEGLKNLKNKDITFDSISFIPSETEHITSTHSGMLLITEHEDSIVLKYTTIKAG